LGATNAQIAARLKLSDGTVKQYISMMFQKTGCGNRTALAVWYVTFKGASATKPARAKPSTNTRKRAK
jgi:DNA-binding NarL/FixJ family response regulator